MPYYVYVISLKKEVLKHKAFREANPDYIEGKECYYVGQTGKLPRVRSEEHRTGLKLDGSPVKQGKYVKDYHNGLTTKYKRKNPMKTREEVLDMEAYVTRQLRKKGFAVWSN